MPISASRLAELDRIAGADTRGANLDPYINKYSAQYGVDPVWAKAIVAQESAFDPYAVSGAGAAGAWQLMDRTNRGIAEQLGETVTEGDRFDPETSTRRAIFHLSDLKNKLGSEELATAAYKSGEGSVRRAGGIPNTYDPYVSERTPEYVQKITSHKQRFLGEPTRPSITPERLAELDKIALGEPEKLEKITPRADTLVEPRGEVTGGEVEIVDRPKELTEAQRTAPEPVILPHTGDKAVASTTATPQLKVAKLAETAPARALGEEFITEGKQPEEVFGIKEGRKIPKKFTPGGATLEALWQSMPFVGSDAISDKYQEEFPIETAIGLVGGTVAQGLIGGKVTPKALSGLKSTFVKNVLSRAAVSLAIKAGQEAPEVAQGKREFEKAFQEGVRNAVGAGVSVLPEMIPGWGPVSTAVIQAIGQPLTDVIYEYTTGKLLGEDVNSGEWWLKNAPNFALAEAFSIKDIASGQTFKISQDAMREDAGKALKSFFNKVGKLTKIEITNESMIKDLPKIEPPKTQEDVMRQIGVDLPKDIPAAEIGEVRPQTAEERAAARTPENLDIMVSKRPQFVEGETKTAEDITPDAKAEDVQIGATKKLPSPEDASTEGEQRVATPEETQPVRETSENLEPFKTGQREGVESIINDTEKAPVEKEPVLATKAAEVPSKIEEIKNVSSGADEIKKIVPQETKESADQEVQGKLEKEDEEFLTGFEKVYTEVKDLTVPMKKIQKLYEIETGNKVPETEDVGFAINRVRGSGGIAKQFRDANLKPILEKLGSTVTEEGKLKKLPIKQRSANAKKLEDYLIAKRQQWLYENKAGYRDEGYSKSKADKVVSQFEGSKNVLDKKVVESAKDIWGYTKKLKEIKKQFGIVDEELEQSLKEPYYVPFFRDVPRNKAVFSGGGDKFATTSRGIRRIKGTETGHRIKNIYQNLIEHTNETIVNAARNDVFRKIINLGEKVPSLQESFKELPARWRKQGTIEHRAEVDKILSPEIDKIIGELGASKDIKVRTGKKLGSYRPTDERITMMFGATESTKAHELGHHIDEKVLPLKGMINKYANEFDGVARTRLEGEETTAKYRKYVNQSDEKAAEFVSMYITDRPLLQRIAPNAIAEFEAKIAKHPTLKKLVDIAPSRVKGIEKLTEDNWVMDNSIPKDEDVISGFIDGKIKHFRVPKELAVAVKNLRPEQIPTALRILSIPAGILRRSAVNLNVDFVVPNVVRDQINASFHSKNIPGWDFLRGLKHYVKQDEVYQKYMAQGGAMDSPEAGIQAMKQSANDLVLGSEGGKFLDPNYWKETGKLRGTTDLLAYTLGAPFKGVGKLAETSEMATRLGVFERQMKSGESIQKSINTARQATLDFQRFGKSGKIPNSIIPFVNAALEGVDRMGRTAIEDPKRLLLASFVYGIAPTIALTEWNRRNKNYKNISDREKENNYIIMEPKSEKYFKIPKSHAVKFVVNPFQIAYERSLGTSKGKWTDIASNALGNASPIDNVGTLVPTTLKLIIEPISNYDFFWRKEIESEQLKRIAQPGLRHKRGTSETLKTIGKALNISPVMLQHEINSLFSGAGRHTIFGLDWALGVSGVQKPVTITEDKIPILRRFHGKAESWKSETERMIREIDSSVRRINRLSTKNLQKYNKYTPEQAKLALIANKKIANKLLKKKVELLSSLDKNEDLIIRIRDTMDDLRKVRGK